ncbi:hypothetical protein [Vulcanisaeta thermophila]|uniref:hypothetical protein n=1 Tax=Vulcanisaeta thermophila TaxID=867917 RepID=UPI000853BB33|nr:hypothetical protein [Vulcanisaeta thermophila]
MHRLFAYMALIRFMEFVLVTLDLAYLGVVYSMSKFLIIILMTAIIYSLLSVATYSLTLNPWLILIFLTAVTAIDLALVVLVSLTYIMPIISLYTTCFIDVVLDAAAIVLNLELIRR